MEVTKSTVQKDKRSVDMPGIPQEMTTIDLLEINAALGKVSEQGIDDGDTNYTLAKNLKICKPIVDAYKEEVKILHESYCEKDKNGRPALDQFGQPIFTTHFTLVKSEIEKLNNAKVAVDFYTSPVTDETKKIKGNVLAHLLDVIFI